MKNCQMHPMSSNTNQQLQAGNHLARAAAMATLARADVALLKAAYATHWQGRTFRELKPTQTGLVMIRGRIGGDGAPFNLGEATASKAIIELDNGTRGYGQCLGRNAEKARFAAVFDALWQDDPALVDQLVLAPIRSAIEAARQTAAAQTAATKVDFFTLVRGED